ncbi:MAG: efflux RND transporter periplasmic adaptor subunit [Lacunisphaera sp.]|jgi:HlyD family secretion protein|nr:efflux RND transporter periplasmic adaptor subunit [Lacunisphaera sp.]
MTPSPLTRALPYILGAGLLVALGFGLRPKPAPVETALAAPGSLRATVCEEGKTRIRQRYVVSSPVTGQLRRVPFKPGATVTAGDVVAVIEPMAASPLDTRSRALAEARRDSAVATLEKTRTSYALAANELNRMARMLTEKTVSPQDFESVQMRETTASREVVAAEGALRAAVAELAVVGPDTVPSLIEVRAPVAGRVLHVFQESERPVTAGTPLLDVGDPADLEVVIELLSRDGAALAAGARVELEQWGGPQPLAARVRLVEPAAFTKISALGVEEQRVNVVADIITPVAERASLGDNFRVEARVLVWETENTLKVPVSALFRHGNESAAYVVRGGKAVIVPVVAGRSSGREVQILKGLTAGDEVILYPGDRISDGQRVKPVKI